MKVGDRVVYKGGESFQPGDMTAGIYTLHNTDDYVMCGFVEVMDSLGCIFVVDARYLESV